MPGESRGRQASRAGTGLLAVALTLCAGIAAGQGRDKDRTPTNGDDLVFRPTVIVRKGDGQGSGTIIASVAGETLILTAAHVVREAGPIGVELHRYNLGVERVMPPGGWPVTLPGEVAATDPAGDVALVRVQGRPALPFVARLGAVGDQPKRGAIVTSVGIDKGQKLECWSTRVRGDVWFALASKKPGSKPRRTESQFQAPASARDGQSLDPGGRPFLLTVRPPERGRSGGGLFLDGRNLVLVGVCVGRVEAETVKGQAIGVFASAETVRRLLREHDLESLVARSEAAREQAGNRER